MKKLFSIFTAVLTIAVISTSAFAAAETGNTGNGTTVNKKADRESGKEFKGKLTDRFAELGTLRAEAKTNREQIKEINQSIKAKRASIKETLKGMENKEDTKKLAEEIKSKIEPYKNTVESTRSEIKALKETKKSEWAAFRAAVKDINLEQATSSLNHIIQLKGEIVSRQKTVIQAKSSILSVLQSY